MNHARTCLAAAGLCLAALTGAAQSPDSSWRAPRALTLDAVIRATLAANASIRSERRQVEYAEGGFMEASAAFDPQVNTSVGSSRANNLSPVSTRDVVSTVATKVDYAVGVDKQLRSGLVVSPSLSISKVGLPVAAGGGGVLPNQTSRAAANITVLLPLANNRWGAVARASENAAEAEWHASQLDLRHTVASTVYDASSAYWNYAAAVERLTVQRSSEARAQQMVDNTEQLVRGGERPEGDLKQLRANVATKRATRIAAEQSVADSWLQLAVVMGLPGSAALATPAVATGMPDAAAAAPSDPARDATLVRALVDTALRQRDDLAADRRHRDAARLALDAAAADLAPHVDLLVGVGYAGLSAGPGMGRFFQPLYRNVFGLDASAQLRYTLPAGNSLARGRTLQSEAAFEQQRIGEEDLARRIEASVRAAFDALARARLALGAANDAVTLSRAAVENEERRFQLGVSTLFDIISVQDALTNAMLTEVASRRTYAGAIAALQFQSGMLVEAGGQTLSVRTERLLSAP